MNNENEKEQPVLSAELDTKETDVDENMSLFIYGNIKIRDIDTGEILVNKRF